MTILHFNCMANVVFILFTLDYKGTTFEFELQINFREYRRCNKKKDSPEKLVHNNKKQPSTIYVGQHYAQTNTNNVNKTSKSTFYDNPSMVMITCRAQRSPNRQKISKKSADHINSDKIKLYTKFIYRLKFAV